MKLWPRTLSLRLALMFALSSCVLLGAVATYLYHSLEREILWRDDQALLGRLQRMQALLDDTESIEALRSRPQLYENMLGNRDNFLWIVDAADHMLIEVNPASLPLPKLPDASSPKLGNDPHNTSLRLAWLDVSRAGGRLKLIAGKHSDERNQMLSAYRTRIWVALVAGALLAFALGWLVSRRGLRPVRTLATQAAGIDARHLHMRLDDFADTVELEVLSQALNQMLDRLEQGFAQLSRFSEDLAHEMRTPLTNLMGQSQQLLGRSRSPEEYQNVLASNLEEYERLARMIDSMLFLARCEQPKATLKREPVDLYVLVEQLCEYFEGMAEDRGIHLVNRSKGTLDAEPELLRRALANLTANALRYGAADSPVTISTKMEANTLEIMVHNLGIPIEARHLPHLFERFYRCDASRNQPDDSGGLGLAIVQSIMRIHMGEASVKSDATGTVFSLHFTFGSCRTGVQPSGESRTSALNQLSVSSGTDQ
ncbi:heavy metal sensor histidine kinase [Ectopseudomonas alcaliphila]|uniref:Sensor protein n=1 Tax=Ectopseudomonas alcaliphila TaxID=101564 RepID=A0A1G7EM33_9GAMM|nr:heavy metal sensor histidine kinase [Pseudomonas alcaliphila]MDX5990866.1 heavy metal sensor histidine kinase [Pseudomonas alcaliphila]SDE64694.1 two-component system, OmpR family, heavy metal sensor histidine kinase CusS [Pseudomonas alcaliphila]